ncbi:MAG: archaeosine biosynthesis radical SAM protein RaSEA [Candidatus Hodarchaeota archaeon]
MTNEELLNLLRKHKERIANGRNTRILSDLDHAFTSWFSPARLHSTKGHELVIILSTRGCEHFLSGSSGCSMCGYNKDSAGEAVPPGSILNQFTNAIGKHDDDLSNNENIVLKIFNSGSFLDDGEISASIREDILSRIASVPSIKEVAVESRPEFIKESNLEPFQSKLRDDQFKEIGIGLETWNDTIRLEFINKGFTLNDFLDSNELLKNHGVGTKVYLFLKPLFLSELQAYKDIKHSLEQLASLDNVSTISINPAAIHKDTLMENLFSRRIYRPPWLWTTRLLVDEALKMRGTGGNPLILCDPVAGGKHRGAHNCKDKKCNYTSLDLIKESTMEQEPAKGLNPLANGSNPSCNCFFEWIDEMEL